MIEMRTVTFLEIVLRHVIKHSVEMVSKHHQTVMESMSSVMTETILMTMRVTMSVTTYIPLESRSYDSVCRLSTIQIQLLYRRSNCVIVE